MVAGVDGCLLVADTRRASQFMTKVILIFFVITNTSCETSKIHARYEHLCRWAGSLGNEVLHANLFAELVLNHCDPLAVSLSQNPVQQCGFAWATYSVCHARRNQPGKIPAMASIDARMGSDLTREIQWWWSQAPSRHPFRERDCLLKWQSWLSEASVSY